MSMPFYAKEFAFHQPDGTTLQVRGWGDQHRAVFEALDGHTVVENPRTGYYEYAARTPDRRLRPSGLLPGAANPALLGEPQGLRPSPAAARAQVIESPGLPPGRERWRIRRERRKAMARVQAAVPEILRAPPSRPSVGRFVGLCLLVDFPDVPGTIPAAEVNDFCNRSGYTGYGNNGSVRDFFLSNSLDRLEYTNLVVDYYTAKQPREYYTDERVPQPTRARELIEEALSNFLAKGGSADQLTADDEGYVYATNVFYAGWWSTTGARDSGLTPSTWIRRSSLRPERRSRLPDYRHGLRTDPATFCHENGHMVCDFPDLYDYGSESNGVGAYCLMCAGGNMSPKNPVQVNAYLKYRAGWAGSVSELAAGQEVIASAEGNVFCIHRRSPTEYFIIENRQSSGGTSRFPRAASRCGTWTRPATTAMSP